MPNTPRRMEREKLAEQFSALKHFIQNRNDLTDTGKYTIQNTLDTIEAFASAWLDREIETIHKAVIQKLKKAGVGGLARLQVTFAFGEALRSAPGKVDER